MSKKNKKNKKNDIKKGVDSYISSTEIKLLERLTESNHKYLRDISTTFLKEYAALKYKFQNNFSMMIDFVQRVKRFVTEFKQNLIPSPNLQMFFLAMELELMLTKYYGVSSKYRELCLKNQNFHTFLEQLEGSVSVNMNYDVAYSEKYRKRIKQALDYLGTAVHRIYKYNEFCFDNEVLEQELESKLSAHRQLADQHEKFDILEKKEWLTDETIVYKEAVIRLNIINKLAGDAFADYKKILPDEAESDIRYFKNAITRTKNLIAELRNLIEKGQVA